jgi:hypothetical protein
MMNEQNGNANEQLTIKGLTNSKPVIETPATMVL